MSEDNLRNPFVVLCTKCSKILTDSFTLLDYRNGNLIHTFSTVKEQSRVEIGDENAFKNCMIQKVVCTCHSTVGYFLASASGDYNGYAGSYAFNKNAVCSYTLGNSVTKEKGLYELAEDIEKLKSVVTKIYRKVY